MEDEISTVLSCLWAFSDGFEKAFRDINRVLGGGAGSERDGIEERNTVCTSQLIENANHA